MMIDIVKNIFESNHYQIINISISLINGTYFIFEPEKDNDKEEYFVVLELSNQNESDIKTILGGISEYLFNVINASGMVQPYFSKNSTLIICHKDDCIERLTTLSIEEDLYDFKKNIITYTENELNDFKNYTNKLGLDELKNEVLRDIINENSGDSFINYKNNNTDNSGYYSFLVKIFLKLPFLIYQTEEKELSKVDEEINNNLTEKQRNILANILRVDEDWTEENTYKLASFIWGENND